MAAAIHTAGDEDQGMVRLTLDVTLDAQSGTSPSVVTLVQLGFRLLCCWGHALPPFVLAGAAFSGPQNYGYTVGSSPYRLMMLLANETKSTTRCPGG
jgi:hypothetical protein